MSAKIHFNNFNNLNIVNFNNNYVNKNLNKNVNNKNGNNKNVNNKNVNNKYINQKSNNVDTNLNQYYYTIINGKSIMVFPNNKTYIELNNNIDVVIDKNSINLYLI